MSERTIAEAPAVLNMATWDRKTPPQWAVVYIGRGSPYGNPYRIGAPDPDQERHGQPMDRERVIVLYARDVVPRLTERDKGRLVGMNVLCYCAPLPCHGDLLLRVVNGR